MGSNPTLSATSFAYLRACCRNGRNRACRAKAKSKWTIRRDLEIEQREGQKGAYDLWRTSEGQGRVASSDLSRKTCLNGQYSC